MNIFLRGNRYIHHHTVPRFGKQFPGLVSGSSSTSVIRYPGKYYFVNRDQVISDIFTYM